MRITDDDKLYKGILSSYSKRISIVTQEIIDQFSRAILNAKAANSYWTAQSEIMRKLYDKLSKLQVDMIQLELPGIYKKQITALNAYTQKVLKAKIRRQRKKINDLLDDRDSRRMLQSINANVTSLYSASSANGMREVEKVFRATQQSLISDTAIGRQVAAARSLGDIQLASESLEASFNAILEAKVVMVNGRRYKPSYYSRLVARTQFHELQTYAAKRTAENYDFDLVRVSSHNTTTPVCQQYEGKVYSTGGRTPGFPLLGAAPPFHPNCLHNLFPESKASLEAQGILGRTRQFSQGEIKKPPIPKNFIPVKKRPKLSVKQEDLVKQELAKFKSMKKTRISRLKDLSPKTKAYRKTQSELKRLNAKIQHREIKLETEGGWDKLL